MVNLIRKYFNFYRRHKGTLTTIAGITYTLLRYLIYQAEYYKSGWAQERIMHQADNIRCQEQLEGWITRDSIRNQQIWDKAFSNARERILQPAIDSISKL